MDGEEAHAIGYALWRVRDKRRLSLWVVAGLAGMSKDTLNRIERGLLSPTLNQIHALAEALQTSASELTRLPFPAPANGHTDSTIEAIRRALDAIDVGHPGGMVLPAAALLEQVDRIHRQRRACRSTDVAIALPGLIRNLHTTLATGGADHGELLDLAVYLHVHVTRMWLLQAAAPTDLVRRTIFLAQRLAQERDAATTLAVAGFGVAQVLLDAGAFEVGRAALDSITLPPATATTAGLVCFVTSCHAQAAVLDGRLGDAAAAMETASDVAERFSGTGEVDSLGFLYTPIDVCKDRVWLAHEAGEPDRAASIAQDVQPRRHPFPVNQVYYWVYYGRALTALRDRRDDAVRALRTAEDIFPTKVRRDPLVRDTLAVLLRTLRRGSSVDEELRGMARRAGLFA